MDTIRLPQLAISVFLLLSFLATERLAAQGPITTTTSNAFVAADVENGSGLITIYHAATQPKELLSYSDHSYFTVQVGGVFFTNNPNGATDVEPSGTQVTPIYLGTSGSTKLVPGSDTLQTVWQPKGPNAFDIVQNVYPVAGVSSGQIVYKWSVVNHTPTGFFAQAQFLLDLATDHNGSPVPPPYGTDIPAVTTRDGFNADTWQDISNVPYFLTSEYRACDKNFPGILGAGFMVDDFAPVAMGLLKPSEVEVVDWNALVQMYLFGFPDSLSGSIMGDNDNAMLFQWPPTGVFGARNGTPTVQEIGRGSYGTPPCTPITFGSLDALLLHPDHIKWNGSAYVPNHFPVEAIVWNPNDNNGNVNVRGASATQSISNSFSGAQGPIEIVSPERTQSFLVDSSINICSSSFVTWEDTVLANILTNCTTDSSYDITLSVSATNVQQPIFSIGLPVCPIIVDCQEKDTASTIPILTVLSRTGSFDGSICNARAIHGEASDPRMCASCFVKSVTATQLQNMTFAIEDSTSWEYVVSVIDSMQNGSATVYALDNTGVWDTAQYSYCTILDVKAPLLQAGPCTDSTVCSYYVSDTQAWDRGLDTIYFTSVNNVTISLIDSVRGNGVASFSVNGNGSFCVTAIDLAGNRFDTCFGATASVAASQNPPFALSISPNPASGVATITLSQAGSTAPRGGTVEIFDVLGRKVASFRVAGSYEWQMGTLPAGTYIVRADAGGAIVSRRVVKQ